jgi:DNA-binding transcriptional LysR family regulator
VEHRQIRYFLALAEEQNFTRAAERLHMAQPPLTRQIKALEDELGYALFTRTPRGVTLTDAGQALWEDLPKVLAMTDSALERAQRASRGQIGRLDVGIFGSGILDVIPRLLARFHARRPEVRIVLHNLSKSEQIQALRERRISVGFNRLIPPEDDLAVETVMREPLMVALPQDHPLATRTQLTIADLDGLPLILYPNLPMPGLAQQIMQAFGREGVRLHVEHEVEEVVTAIALVAGGFGVCVTSASTAALRLPGVVYLPLHSVHLAEIELSCVSLRSNTSAVLAAFLDQVKAFSQEMPAASPLPPAA